MTKWALHARGRWLEFTPRDTDAVVLTWTPDALAAHLFESRVEAEAFVASLDAAPKLFVTGECGATPVPIHVSAA